jgi:hypothetical protein
MSYADNRPLLTTIVYLGFVVLVSHRVVEDYKKLKSKGEFNFNVVILVLLIVFGIYSLVDDTTHVVEFSKISIKKFTNNPGYLQNQLNQINKLKYYTDTIEQELIK